MYVKEKKIVYSTIGILIILISLFLPEMSYNVVLLTAVLCFGFMFISWISSTNVLNFYTLFLGSCAAFYYGQYIVHFLTGEDINRWMSITSNFSKSEMNSVALYILRCLLILHVSVLLFYNTESKKAYRDLSEKKVPKVHANMAAHKIASSLLFAMTYAPAMMIGIYKAALINTLNYSDLLGYKVALFGGGIDKIIRVLASFCIAAFFYVVISFKDSKFIKLYVLLIVLYIGVYYLSGSRLRATLFILIAMLIYNDHYRKITRKKLFVMIPIGATVLLLVGGIGFIRSSFSSYGSIVDIMKGIIENFIENNVFISLLSEFGMTAVVVANVVNHCPSSIRFIWGKSYLFSLLYILPGFIWNEDSMLSIVDTDTVFHNYINKYSGVGSSFIAEAYYNFGYGSYIIMFIYGFLLAFIMRNLFKANYRGDIIQATMLYYVLALVLFSIRSDLYSILRETLYVFIIIKFLYKASVEVVTKIQRRG